MEIQQVLPPREVLSAAHSCAAALQRLQIHGHDISLLLIELWNTVSSNLRTGANAQLGNVQGTSPYRDILSKASTTLRDAFYSASTDDRKKDDVLDDWSFTLDKADTFADPALLSDNEQQSRIELWRACRTRFAMAGTSGNLERILRAGLKVLEVVPATSGSHLDCALDVGANLGRAYKSRIASSGLHGLSLLQAAISRLSGALAGLSKSDPRREQHQPILDDLYLNLINESATFQTHFWETETFSYLEQAVSLAKQAWEGLATSKSREARYRANYELGLVRKYRYLHLGQFSDLQNALECTLAALTDWPPGSALPSSDVAKAMRSAWCLLYHNKTDLEQLDESRAVLSDLEKSHKDGDMEPGVTRHVGSAHAFYLNALSEVSRISHHRRCHFDRSPHWIDSGVEYSQRSCNHVGPQDPGRYEAVVELVTALMTRFGSAAARSDDLDRAIEAAIIATGLAYDPIYTNLQNTQQRCQRYICKTLDVAADVLTARFLRDRDPRDLDEADHAAHCVMISTHSLHPSRPYQVFSELERCRFRLLHEDQKTSGYSRLSNLLKRRSCQDRLSIPVGDGLPSVAALLSASVAMKSTSCENSIYRRNGLTVVLGNEPIYLDDLSRVAERGSYRLDLKFTHDSPQYLLESRPCHQLSLKEQDLESLSAVLGHPEMDESRFSKKSISDSEDLFGILSLIEKAIKATIARKDPSTALELRQVAIKLLDNIDLVMSEDRPSAEQTRLVQRLPLLIAKELLVQSHHAWDCVRALEAGKEGGSRYEPRMLNSFFYKAVRLIREADEINARLRHTTTEWQDRMQTETTAEDKFKQPSAALLNAVKELAKIKELIPDHDSFENECLKQAANGPIVFLVPTKHLSFAILVSSSSSTGAEVLHLPEAPARELRTRLKDTFGALKECEETGIKGKVNPKLRKLLDWLWRAVVKQVVVKLNLKPNYSTNASLKLPLIRWVTFGPFAQTPLHAAGQYRGQKPAMLSHYAISSYLPSIRYATLTHRRYSSDSSISPNTLLMIGMPKTDTTRQGERLADLDFDRERDCITTALRGRFDLNYLINPEMGALESLLSHVRLAHFTCHGLLHASDPLLSRLVIWKDDSRPLTVASIRKMAIPGAKLAFVSACHSAIYRKETDEGENSQQQKDQEDDQIDGNSYVGDDDDDEPPIHLARALQYAGFPAVVGTLWHAYQDSAIEISGHFYQFVADRWDAEAKRGTSTKGMDGIMDGAFFARALHHALRCYQEGGDGEGGGRGGGGNLWKAVDWAGWMCFGD